MSVNKDLDMTKRERVDYLDIAKGIGILLVIIAHIPNLGENARQYIVAFHMPLFFIISGMLIRYTGKIEESTTGFVRKRARSLLLPYAFFSVMYFVIELCRMLIKGEGEWNQIYRQLFQTVCLQGVSVLWFFPALFIAEVTFVFIRKRCNHILTMFSLAILMFVTFRLTAMSHVYFFAHTGDLALSFLFDLVSMLLRGLFCAGLVGMGYYIGLVMQEWKFPVLADAGAGVLSLGAVVIVAGAGTLVDLRYMFLGKVSLFLVGGLLGSLGVIFLSRFIAHFPTNIVYKAGKYLGINSMLIMVTHLDFKVLSICIKLVTALGEAVTNNAVFCILVVVLVCIFEIFIIELTKRVLPIILRCIRKNS